MRRGVRPRESPSSEMSHPDGSDVSSSRPLMGLSTAFFWEKPPSRRNRNSSTTS